MPPSSAPQRQRPNMKTEGEAAKAARIPAGQPKASARRRVPRRPTLEMEDKKATSSLYPSYFSPSPSQALWRLPLPPNPSQSSHAFPQKRPAMLTGKTIREASLFHLIKIQRV